MELFFAYISDSLTALVPSLVLIGAFCALMWEWSRRQKPVLAAPALHLPGGSLQPSLAHLNEKLAIRLLATVLVAVLTGVAAQAQAVRGSLPFAQGILLAGCAFVLGLSLWTWETFKVWRAGELKLENERRVGSELNLLMLDGCRVFHDLPTGQSGNLDHIIVAPHAVFAVETRTVKLRWRERHSTERTVIFDGRQLRFPGFTTTQPLRVALRQAHWLETQISRMTAGLKIPVQPILVLPGWQIEQRGKGDVKVLNVEDIPASVVDKAATPLYSAHRQAIVNLLDAQCRDLPPQTS